MSTKECSLSGGDIHTFERGAEACRCGERDYLNRPAKLAIAVRAHDLDELIAVYLATQSEDSAANLRQTFMREFLTWVRKREEAVNRGNPTRSARR